MTSDKVSYLIAESLLPPPCHVGKEHNDQGHEVMVFVEQCIVHDPMNENSSETLAFMQLPLPCFTVRNHALSSYS